MPRRKLTNSEKRAKKLAKQVKIKELRGKIDKIKSDNEIIHMENFDWKEMNDEVYKAWEKTTEVLGGQFLLDPKCFGSDCFDIVISKKVVNLEELKELHKLKEELEELEF